MFDWTDERVELLKARLEDGRSASQIAAELGCTRNAVIGKTHRLRMKLKGWHGTQRVLRRRRSERRIVIKQTNEPEIEIDATPLQEVEGLDPLIMGEYAVAQLEPHHCRYPYGDPKHRGTFGYCGRDRRDIDTPYCPEHHALCRLPPKGDKVGTAWWLERTLRSRAHKQKMAYSKG